MSKIIQLLLLLSLYSTLIYAIDLNSTNEIINQATKATKKLEVELNGVVNDVKEKTEVVTDEVIKDTVIEDSNSTNVERVNIDSNISNTPKEEEISVDKGDPKKGKNIFKYVLKEDCNMSAYKFAEQYSQEEWIEILEEHKIKETIFKTCPNVKNYYQDRWTDDLYQFFYEASNEDEIPEC
ncbi:hypothetical protein MNB_SV-14-270 [hydrothermal vent metagenome]|uniref:Uncharacterized protein n=1 Tax=hydrothermal vent metagenome TaxID=652676 RepID=A0A1W1C9A5_9ZZZZ